MTTNADTVTASTENFSLKSRVGPDGQEREFVEGFLATTHEDKGNDQFTEEALRGMAEDINENKVEDVDAVFNDVDMDALREAQVGNLDHNNNPASPFGDTRTVPAFKITEADVENTDDGEKGLHVKAMLNSDGMMPETVSAVKNSIKDGFLNAFSVEFIPKKVKQEISGEKVVRVIQKAAAKGAALTGRPMNPFAEMTDAQLKSMADEYIEEDENNISTMTDEQEDVPEEEPDEEVPEEEETKSEGEPEGTDEEESGDEEQEEEEAQSFSEEVEELKESVSEVKSLNEELRDENEELKSELEDLRQLQEIKSEVDEVKSILDEVELEDGPRVQQEQKRFEDEETKAEWKQAVDRVGKDYLKSEDYIEAFAENHSIEEQEVKNYVNSD